MVAECARCDSPEPAIKCSCGKLYCAKCWPKHKSAKPYHKSSPYQTGPTHLQRCWNYVKGTLGYGEEAFTKDEGAKWFGLVEDSSFRPPIYRIIVTSRFSEITEASQFATENSPKRQYPCLVSFVGATGSGKSSLSESASHHFFSHAIDHCTPQSVLLRRSLYIDWRTFRTLMLQL